MNAARRYGPALAAVLIGYAVSAASAAESTVDVLEEVIVTAQKEVSTEQKTPISMQVYSASELAHRGVVDLQTLAQTDPSLTFAMSTSEPYLALRGVSTGNVTETGDPSVAVATDGIFLNRSYSLNAGMFDLERVEILRGPQGTLYGRNAVGGVVSIVTNKPGDTFGGNASIDAGNYNAINLQGAINMPLTSWLAVRLSGASFKHDGYRDNSPSRTNGDDLNTHAVRAQVALHPTENFKAVVGFTYTSEDDAGKVSILLPFNPTDHSMPALGRTDQWPIFAPQFQRIYSKDWKWDIAYGGLPGGVTINLLGGYNSIEWHHASPVLADPGGGNRPGGTSSNTSYFQNEFPKTVSHELRISSPADARLGWQFGGYYFKEKSSVQSRMIDNFGTTFENHDITTFNFPQVDSESKAGFGQLSFKANDKLKLTAGARYTKDSMIRVGTFDLFLNLPPPPNGPGPIHITPPVNGQSASSKTTWLVDADYDITSHSMLYAKTSTGYKAGGFTGAGSYDPESMTAYEVGSKNRFLDEHLQVNGAVFFMNYKGQQVNQFSDPQAGAQTLNVDSRLYGFEGSMIALANQNNRFNLSVNYLHSKIMAFVPPAGYPSNGNPVVGNSVPMSPEWAASAGYEASMAGPAGVYTAGVQAKYEADKYTGVNNFPDTLIPSHTTVDLSLGYKPNAGNWDLQAYVRNVTNKAYFVDAEEVYPGAGSRLYSYAAPRTFGLRVSASFK